MDVEADIGDTFILCYWEDRRRHTFLSLVLSPDTKPARTQEEEDTKGEETQRL